MKIDVYTGGLLETNAYLVEAPEGPILIDAPEGAAEWLSRRAGPAKVRHLLLTHGHYDHTFDAGAVKRQAGCRIWVHRDSAHFVEHPDSMLAYSPYPELPSAIVDGFIEENDAFEIAGLSFKTLLCPGHCPGSICLYHAPSRNLFGGDVLFAGGVGRWDLPGGGFEMIRDSIQQKLYKLPDDTRVWPGHGPATTIGTEKKSNPYVKPS